MARYALQSVARSWLWQPDDGLKGDWHRLAGCHRWLGYRRDRDGEIAKSTAVDVFHDPERLRAYYGALQSCGSSWVDPVCSGAIYDHRRREVASVLDYARAEGWSVLFLTLTAAHKQGDALKPLLAKLAEAMRRVYAGREFQVYRSSVGYKGAVKGVEVTYGANGWHPHFHLLWLTRAATARQTASYVDRAWSVALAAVGLSGLAGIRATVFDGSLSAAQYVVKFDRIREWDLDAELTMWARKSASKGASPWDLLRFGLAGEADPVLRDQDWAREQLGVVWARSLFSEYAAATKGRHSLRFSRGLRKLVGLAAEVGDEAVAAGEANDRPVHLLARLDRDQWRRVLANDCRGELLQAAAAGDPVRLSAFLASIGIELVEDLDYEQGRDMRAG